MKTIFTGSHKTTEEHYTVISLKFIKFYLSTYVNRFTSKSVCILHIPSLVNFVNFIEIDQVVLKYGQPKVSTPLKFKGK